MARHQQNIPAHIRDEIKDLQDYLAAFTNPDGTMAPLPEQSINGVFNKLSPDARQFLREQQQFVENHESSGGRQLPFEEKRPVDRDSLPPPVKAIADQAATEALTYGLNSRMGTPSAASTPDSPPSMRDHIDLAFDTVGDTSND